MVVTGQLDHPNIVPIYDLARDESGQLFYAMKRVEGRSWDACMHEEGRTRHDNVEILMKVCDAIRFAHDRGVIHRDIKPQNIMVGKYGEVSVMDWGIALRSAAQGSTCPAGTRSAPAARRLTWRRKWRPATRPRSGRTPTCTCSAPCCTRSSRASRRIRRRPTVTIRLVQQNACLLIAARNVITPAKETGELVDIAYKAMATDISESVSDRSTSFKSAIREYFSHAESIALADRGQAHLTNAPRAAQWRVRGLCQGPVRVRRGDPAVAGEHPRRNGLAESTIAYADRAYKDGNYGLGISLLDPANEQHTDLLKRLKAAKRTPIATGSWRWRRPQPPPAS